MAILGIDLGTTNSLTYIWRGNGPELLTNSLGNALTPSVVGLDDNGNVIAPIANMLIQQKPVRHVLMRWVHRPRMSGCRERAVRHVKAGQDFDNSGDFFRRLRIDLLYIAMRDFRMFDAHVKCFRRDHIFIILRPAGHFIEGIYSYFTFIRNAHVSRPLSA